MSTQFNESEEGQGQLRNCPDEFYNICKNANVKCHKCGAGFGEETMRVLFTPKEISFNKKHPYSYTLLKIKAETKRQETRGRVAKKSTAKSKQIRQGYSNERRQINKIVKETRRSGAKFGDGDMQILDDIFRADAKLRFNKKSFTLTREEFIKGRAAGVNTWFITVKVQNLEQTTVVVLTEEAYNGLLSLADIGLKHL